MRNPHSVVLLKAIQVGIRLATAHKQILIRSGWKPVPAGGIATGTGLGTFLADTLKSLDGTGNAGGSIQQKNQYGNKARRPYQARSRQATGYNRKYNGFRPTNYVKRCSCHRKY